MYVLMLAHHKMVLQREDNCKSKKTNWNNQIFLVKSTRFIGDFMNMEKMMVLFVKKYIRLVCCCLSSE